jgi:hypothetical protein
MSQHELLIVNAMHYSVDPPEAQRFFDRLFQRETRLARMLLVVNESDLLALAWCASNHARHSSLSMKYNCFLTVTICISVV